MYVLLFLFTCFITYKTDLYYQNITYLSNQRDTYFLYLFWISVMSCFLFYKMKKVYQTYSFLTKNFYYGIVLCILLSIVGAILPYKPGTSDLYSSFHVILSSLGCLGILILQKYILYKGMLVDHPFFFNKNRFFDQGLFFLTLLIILFGSINAIIELYLTCLIFVTLYQLEKKK